jgi:hypothetical protein
MMQVSEDSGPVIAANKSKKPLDAEDVEAKVKHCALRFSGS